MPKIELSQRRYKTLVAAEDFCRAARDAIVTHGHLTSDEMPYLHRWLLTAPDNKYKRPMPIRTKGVETN